MSTQPTPQPPASKPARKPTEPPADAPPSSPDAATSRPPEEDAIFRALLDAGAEAVVAYTAEKRIRTMTSEIAAATVQPLLAEFRELREATKGELRQLREATKAELRQLREATKADSRQLREATKADSRQLREATKADLAELRHEIGALETRMVKWMFGALMAQAALIVALIKFLP